MLSNLFENYFIRNSNKNAVHALKENMQIVDVYSQTYMCMILDKI